eukprot:TRINITY_DN3654_c0_g2_i2.p1 TRINITY_DN3654_c0_g2~~TRINITY_DN3654_c0_g2_i2.p1  ORF type:complete len:180 (-),score=66.65 TRINITY_DN3654_c0_g2_i2:200-739(-)
MTGNIDDLRMIVVEEDLKPGVYHLLIDVEWEKDVVPFTITSYGPAYVDLRRIQQSPEEIFTRVCNGLNENVANLEDAKHEDFGENGYPEIKKHEHVTECFFVIAYENGTSNAEMVDELTFSKLEKLKYMGEWDEEDEDEEKYVLKVKVPPNSKRTYLFKILDMAEWEYEIENEWSINPV